MLPERFSVVVYDSEGYWDYALRAVDPEKAVWEAKRLVDRAEDGDDIDRVMITDADDFTCFLWEWGKGVVFPPRSQRLRGGD